MKYAVKLYGVRKGLDFLQAWKLVFVDPVCEIRHEKVLPVMVRNCVATVLGL
jgi:hypothetical protein